MSSEHQTLSETKDHPLTSDDPIPASTIKKEWVKFEDEDAAKVSDFFYCWIFRNLSSRAHFCCCVAAAAQKNRHRNDTGQVLMNIPLVKIFTPQQKALVGDDDNASTLCSNTTRKLFSHFFLHSHTTYYSLQQHTSNQSTDSNQPAVLPTESIHVQIESPSKSRSSSISNGDNKAGSPAIINVSTIDTSSRTTASTSPSTAAEPPRMQTVVLNPDRIHQQEGFCKYIR